MEVEPTLNKIFKDRFPALSHRDFRVFWIGQSISLLGNWIQTVGLAWLVLTLTDSPFLLGLMETVRFIPITTFSLLAGVIVDRVSIRKLLILTQFVQMLLAFTLSAFEFAHIASYGSIIAIALLLGFATTLYMPARQSYTIELTGKDDLTNALALSSITSNLSRIIGPALGAVVLSIMGAGWCFFFNGLSFLAVITSLISIKDNDGLHEKKAKSKSGVINEIKDGLKYIIKEKPLLQIILLVAVLGVFAYNYDILVPVMTKNILHQSGKSYGFLMSSMGAGALLGAVLLSFKRKLVFDLKKIVWIAVIEAIILILLGITRNFYLAAILLVASGVLNMLFNTATNSALQLSMKDEYRGD